MEWKWNGSGREVKWKWNGSGREVKWKWKGSYVVSFDFDSLMLYGKNDFSKNGLQTMSARSEYLNNIAARWNRKGTFPGLSDKDARRINRMYNYTKTVNGGKFNLNNFEPE